MKYIFFACFILTIFSCNSPSSQSDTKTYFDLKGLLDAQIKLLNQSKPLVKKSLMVSNNQEQTAVTITDWEKELELFRQADLNKPAYKQSYETIKSEKADTTTIEYRLKNTEKLPVKVLRIFLNKDQQFMGLWAEVHQENMIYHSDKTLLMSCDPSKSGATIKSYQVKGYQKLVYFDEKPFSVRGEL